MQAFRAFRQWFDVPMDDADLVLAQVRTLERQIPLLYAILTINSASLAWTFYGRVPAVWAAGLPALMGAVCAARARIWLRQARTPVTIAQAQRRLRAIMRLVPFFGFVFTAWSLSLYRYGDAYARCHVVFFMSVCSITCVFCLMHLRKAALLLMGIIFVPYIAFIACQGNAQIRLMASNLLLIGPALLTVAFRISADFAKMVDSRRQLQLRQAETQALGEENARIANIDGLTGLPNRRRFLTELNATIARERLHHGRFAVALIDLDGFKGVNDGYGHGAGDRLLVQIGERLNQRQGPHVMCARLGGDEFGAILTGNPDQADILAFGQSLCATLRGAYSLGGIIAEISGSVGLVAYPDGGETAENLFERADYALYHAKQSQRGLPVIFSARHETMIRETGRLEQALRHADVDAEMSLVFQPMVDAASGRTVAFEALARWSSPELGQVPPDRFIAIAERAGLIGQLTEALLQKALATAATWPDQIRMSFNLSAHDITEPGMCARLRSLVVESGVRPQRIDFEITETAVMRDVDQAALALQSLRSLGLGISLDDFGTGYSSLSQVQRLKPDKIKIDRSFVAGLREDGASRAIVRTIVDLCRNLNLDCVVEGVETEAQLRVLTGLGCRTMQGYVFSRPMRQEAIAAYLARTTPSQGVAARLAVS